MPVEFLRIRGNMISTIDNALGEENKRMTLLSQRVTVRFNKRIIIRTQSPEKYRIRFHTHSLYHSNPFRFRSFRHKIITSSQAQ